jgi:tetratricopeptide (TPR) repeat protein
MERDFATGVSFLQIVLESTDRLAGTGGAGAFLVPSVAAMVLCSVAELCFNYEQRENAEGYAHAFLDAARQAHGEGSAVVGDAHCLILGMLVKWGRLEEALSHAKMLVEIRRRQSQRIRNDKSLANAHWNLALLSFQVDQNDELTLPSLRAAREIHCQIDGESTKTAEIDVAMGTMYRARGDYKTAVRLYRTAMRERQRFLGFAHPDTRHLASLLDSTEIEMRNSMENTRNDDKIEVASYTKGGESHGSDKRTNNDQKYHF